MKKIITLISIFLPQVALAHEIGADHHHVVGSSFHLVDFGALVALVLIIITVLVGFVVLARKG
jgi:hypothetical protein